MIRIRISDDAFADLDDGYWFHERQESGLGEYFASTLRAEIEGLKMLMADDLNSALSGFGQTEAEGQPDQESLRAAQGANSDQEPVTFLIGRA